MEKWTVEITQTALDDMEGIYDYIAFFWQRRNAMGQYDRIADAILTLESNPERCPVFEVDPDKVTVTDVLYGASNVHARLKARHMAGGL